MSKVIRYISSLDFIEITTGLAVIGFGIILLLPFETFSRFPSYSYMASIANENVWGVVFVLSGMIQVVGAAMQKSTLVILGATIILFLRTFTLASSAINSHLAAPGLADFSAWSAMAIYIIVRNKRNE